MRIGYIDYLNCYPLYHHMLEIEPLNDVHIVPGYPSALNRMMAENELDLSPISAAAYAGLRHEVLLLSDFCLSSIGYVRSVILISNAPIEDLQGKRVGLSSASQTSVVLLKILLSKYYDIEPVYVQTPPYPSLSESGVDAALVIGNDAMQQIRTPYTYDLGDLWLRKTGYPVVFAVVAAQKQSIHDKMHRISSVIKSYHRSLACLDLDREALIQKAQEKYPAITYDIDQYYRLLEYKFTPRLKDALRFYLDIAGELGFLQKVTDIHFLDSAMDYKGAKQVQQEEILQWKKPPGNN